jgi:hypothetical protein
MNMRGFLNCVRMKKHEKIQMIVFILLFLFVGIYFLPSSLSHTISQTFEQPSMMVDGQILFAPMWSTTTYLIDSTGTVKHTWPSGYVPGVAVWWLSDGTILRTIRTGILPIAGGAGGGVQKVEWDGTIVWDFRYDTNGTLSHHDVYILPNGNVLLIAWETKTRDQAIAAGRNPSYISSSGLLPDHVIEVQPTGPTSGTIVWEWHAWDHLIQDYDSSKANYGSVGDNPELIDLNYLTSTEKDWMHTDSIDYNEEFDQILLSVHNFNEIWVIDHSTTTQEAAGHTGGNSGKGGDLLYRWGNPVAYRRGTINDQKLFSPHDASWIKPGNPGEGDILFFNNGVNRPGGEYSSVDEITPPVDVIGNYFLAPSSAFGPIAQTWIYTANPPTSFFVSHLSSAQRLLNGNTLICDGESGNTFEVTSEGLTVWQVGTATEVFKIVYIPLEEPGSNTSDLDCSGSLSWTNVQPGATVSGSFQVQNIGDNNSLLNWTVNISSLTWGTWTITPESGEHLSPENGAITVQVSVIAPTDENAEFEGYIRLENQNDTSDFENIPVNLKTLLDTSTVQFTMTLRSLLLFKIRQWSFLIEKICNMLITKDHVLENLTAMENR